MKLYYLVSVEEINEIMKKGIFEDFVFGISVMNRQGFSSWRGLTHTKQKQFALFEINKEGITGEVVKLPHYLSPTIMQKCILQDWIDPRYLNLEGIYYSEIPLIIIDDFQNN